MRERERGRGAGIADAGISRTRYEDNKIRFLFKCFFGVQLGSSLQCAREFVKAFCERGGDLHIAERQHREVILMPLHQFLSTV